MSAATRGRDVLGTISLGSLPRSTELYVSVDRDE
jgi:hypothetical protein